MIVIDATKCSTKISKTLYYTYTHTYTCTCVVDVHVYHLLTVCNFVYWRASLCQIVGCIETCTDILASNESRSWRWKHRTTAALLSKDKACVLWLIRGTGHRLCFPCISTNRVVHCCITTLKRERESLGVRIQEQICYAIQHNIWMSQMQSSWHALGSHITDSLVKGKLKLSYIHMHFLSHCMNSDFINDIMVTSFPRVPISRDTASHAKKMLF